MSRNSGKNDLSCTEDLGCPLGRHKLNFDSRIDIGIVRCHNPFILHITNRAIECLTRNGCFCKKFGCVIHENNTTLHNLPCGCIRDDTLAAFFKDEIEKVLQRAAILGFMQNASHMKDSILKEFDCNLLAWKSSITLTHHNECDGIVSKPCIIRFTFGLCTTTNPVPTAFAPTQNASLFDLDDFLVDRKFLQK